MEITGNVYCFFEQSGVFKNAFKELGFAATDWDIRNDYGETDCECDLFKVIEAAYDGKPSMFDNISQDDLIIAFFPCIYFTGFSNPRYYTLDNNNYRNLTVKQKFDAIINRADKRNEFFKLINKMVGCCILRNLRIIIENPFNRDHYLYNNFLKMPNFVDNNRRNRGDYFVKPTGYWFFNCEPTIGCSFQKPNRKLTIKNAERSSGDGFCSMQRSIVSPDYARNFICDFIIGRSQKYSQLTLF